METVALLKTNKGHVIAVYASAADADNVAAEYNAYATWGDESCPDPDAPYSVDVWSVQQ
jgi:hypothetical protein